MKTKVLEPRTAIAFSEREWKNLLQHFTRCSECWDPEYVASVNLSGLKLLYYGACEYFMCGPVNAPYARIIVYGIYDIPDLIIDWQKKAVIEALKNNKDFRRLCKERGGRLLWAFADEFDKVRSKKYPVFHVILNNSKSSIEIPISQE